MRYGWPLNAKQTSFDNSIPPNQAGTRQNVDELKRYNKKEREAGSVIGPLKGTHFAKLQDFLLWTSRRRKTTELRVILNLSYPFEGDSVNRGKL